MSNPWDRLADESAQAYAAFCAYYPLPPNERSIDAAWRAAAKPPQNRDGKRASGHWADWSAKFNWVQRAIAHDEYLAELERQKWEQRRSELRERDWAQGDALRALSDAAMPEAYQFLREERRVLPDGTVIVTRAFYLTDLALVIEKASKLQRLATDEPTDHLALSGAALDAYIASQLARLADGDQAPDGTAPQPHEAEADGGAAGGNDAL